MTRLPNVRFWVYANTGPVRITLKPGQVLEWSCGGPTEEGFHHEHHRFEYDEFEGRVLRSLTVDARDCDGRLSRYHDDSCSIYLLQAGDEPYLDDLYKLEKAAWDGVVWPAWEDARRSQRDEYAEMMGY